jgi:tetratricopeptide (TPR) repeat protein
MSTTPEAAALAARFARAGRNDPCPCGSGRKFKKCHGAGDGAGVALPAARVDPVGALVATMLSHVQRDDLDAAERIAHEVLAHDAKHPDALNVAGIAATRRKAYPEAIEHLRRAIAQAPQAAQLHMNLGNVLRESGDAEAALAALDRAAALDPREPMVQFNRLLALGQLRRFDAARQAACAHLAPRDDVEAFVALGERLREDGLFEAMVPVALEALARRPDDHRRLNDAAMAWLELGEFDVACTLLERAAVLAPDVSLVHRNLAIALTEAGRYDRALVAADRARALDPHDVEPWCVRAAALGHAGDTDAALDAFDAALRLAPDHGFARLRRAMLLLSLGRYAEGWPGFEARLEDEAVIPHARLAHLPRWHGEPLAGRTLLVQGEQGQGDALHFVRYAPGLAARGARVVLVVPASLRTLFARVPGVTQVVAPGEPLPACDLWVPLMSLPLVCGTTLDTIPARERYLSADPARVAPWRARIAATAGDDALAVGLCWAGNPAYGTDRRRSVEPDALAPLASVPGVRWVSLQKTPPGWRGAALPAAWPRLDCTDELHDFDDTAALIAALDLVVTVDTSIAHVAASLGQPTWLLNRFDSDWRWGRAGETAPWYAAVRQFRQVRPRDWSAPIDAVRAALVEQVETHGARRASTASVTR